MWYLVAATTEQPETAPDMDALQRAGANALLQEALGSISGAESSEGIAVELDEVLVAVYPQGARISIHVTAPSLKHAEEAVQSVIREALERTELLSGWQVSQCKVDLHPTLAEESLAAAEGPGAPPSDIATRRAQHTSTETAIPQGVFDHETPDQEPVMRAMAAHFRSFSNEDFGHLSEESGEEPFVSAEDAQLAAGALVYATEIVIDELYMDFASLTESDSTAADEDVVMMSLYALPQAYAQFYDARFVRHFLVTAVAMTSRFTFGGSRILASTAEELALKMILEQAASCLELYNLDSEGVTHALEFFKDCIYEDLDHEGLYYAQTAPENEESRSEVKAWFDPFNSERFSHPFALYEKESTVS
jgi:hypothetical protein